MSYVHDNATDWQYMDGVETVTLELGDGTQKTVGARRGSFAMAEFDDGTGVTGIPATWVVFTTNAAGTVQVTQSDDLVGGYIEQSDGTRWEVMAVTFWRNDGEQFGAQTLRRVEPVD